LGSSGKVFYERLRVPSYDAMDAIAVPIVSSAQDLRKKVYNNCGYLTKKLTSYYRSI